MSYSVFDPDALIHFSDIHNDAGCWYNSQFQSPFLNKTSLLPGSCRRWRAGISPDPYYKSRRWARRVFRFYSILLETSTQISKPLNRRWQLIWDSDSLERKESWRRNCHSLHTPHKNKLEAAPTWRQSIDVCALNAVGQELCLMSGRVTADPNQV